MSKKVSKDANKAKVKTANDKRGVIILCLIAFIVILVIAAVILAFIYLGTVKKSNPDKLSSDVANEIRQDEYVVNGDQEIFEELSATVQNCFGKKPFCPSAHPMTITRNTGRVAFRLNIKLSTLIPLYITSLHSRSHAWGRPAGLF